MKHRLRQASEAKTIWASSAGERQTGRGGKEEIEASSGRKASEEGKNSGRRQRGKQTGRGEKKKRKHRVNEGKREAQAGRQGEAKNLLLRHLEKQKRGVYATRETHLYISRGVNPGSYVR